MRKPKTNPKTILRRPAFLHFGSLQIKATQEHFPSKRCYAAVQVALYCDLHGHSRKHGTFMYGCEQAPSPQVSHTSRLLHCMHFSAPPVVSYWSESHIHNAFFVVMYTLARQMELAGCQGTTCEKQCTYQCMCICRPAAAAAAAVVLFVGKGRTGGQAAPQQDPVCFLSCFSSDVLISSPTLLAASGCRGARPALPEWCAGKSLASPTGIQ